MMFGCVQEIRSMRKQSNGQKNDQPMVASEMGVSPMAIKGYPIAITSLVTGIITIYDLHINMISMMYRIACDHVLIPVLFAIRDAGIIQLLAVAGASPLTALTKWDSPMDGMNSAQTLFDVPGVHEALCEPPKIARGYRGSIERIEKIVSCSLRD